MNYAVCPECNGDGGMLRESAYSTHPDGMTFFICGACNGTGEVEESPYNYFAPDAPTPQELWG